MSKKGDLGGLGVLGAIGGSINTGIMLMFALLFILILWWLAKDLVLMVALVMVGFIMFLYGLQHVKGSGKWVAVGLGGILIVLGAGQAMLSVTPGGADWKPDITIDTETLSERKYCYLGEVWLSDTRYISSMYTDAIGQAVTIQGRLTSKWKTVDVCNNHFLPADYSYRVRIYDNGEFRNLRADEIEYEPGAFAFDENYGFIRGRDWNVETYRISNQQINLLSAVFELKGPWVGGFYVDLMLINTIENHEFGWRVNDDLPDVVASVDGAYLYSGVGEVNVIGVIRANGQTLYGEDTAEEGGKVIIDVQCGAGLWELRIAKTRQIETNYALVKALPEGCDQDVEWLVPAGAFTVSTDPLANQYTVRLYNSVIEQSKDDVFVVDKFDYIPPKPQAEFNVNYAIVGEDVIVTMSGDVNNYTTLPIGSFKIDLWYGQSKPGTEFADYWIADNAVVQNVYAIGNDTYGATYTFKAHKAGTISGEVRSIDTEGRASSSTKIKLNAYLSDADPCIQAGVDICAGGFDWDPLIMILVIAIIIIVGYVGYRKLGVRKK